MEQQFWHNAWAKSEKPGWQQDAANWALQQHWVADSASVFVPLCGRSPDLEWLHQQGHTVIGVELSESAVIRFFEERQLVFEKTMDNALSVYTAERYRLYVGDYFAVEPRHLENVTQVYDRAALIAMPPQMRPSYAGHLRKIMPAHAQLMVVLLEYDQQLMNGPPFSVSEAELQGYFAPDYDLHLLSRTPADFARRGVDEATESAFRVHCKNP